MTPFLGCLVQSFMIFFLILHLVRAQDSGVAQAAGSIYLSSHNGASVTFDLTWGVGSTVTSSEVTEVTVISSLVTTVTYSLTSNPVPMSTITTTTPQPGLTASCPIGTPTSVPSFDLTNTSTSSIPPQENRPVPSDTRAHATAASQMASGALAPLPQGSMFWSPSGIGSAHSGSAASGVFYTGLAGNGTSWKLANSNVGLPYSPNKTPAPQGIALSSTASQDVAQSSLASSSRSSSSSLGSSGSDSSGPNSSGPNSSGPNSSGPQTTSTGARVSLSSCSSTNIMILVICLSVYILVVVTV